MIGDYGKKLRYMNCKICNKNNKSIFEAKILNEYTIKYYHCNSCGFLQTENPYWLKVAYSESINISDTGIILRNIGLSKMSTSIIFFFFDKSRKFLDFAGGYGIFTRQMRDIGFDYYWDDKYCKNLVARGFEYNYKDNIELLTSFESFEHFDNPIQEIENMLKISNNILFSTNLISDAVPQPSDWWYYGLEHGQHISFYSYKTLSYIANKYDLYLYTNNSSIHLLTEKKISKYLFKFIIKINRFGLFGILRNFLKSKTGTDMDVIIKKINNA